jgi:hypothetical protein
MSENATAADDAATPARGAAPAAVVNAAPGNGIPPPLQRRLRIAGLLLIGGLVVEGATLLALERPVGFLTFAGVGALLTVAGIVYYLWSIVR